MTDALAMVYRVNLVILVDLAIGLVLLELAVLLLWQRRSGGAPAVPVWLPHLVAGLCLMLALRAALADAAAVWVLLAMAASGAAHLAQLADLRRRWPALRRSPPPGARRTAPSAGPATTP